MFRSLRQFSVERDLHSDVDPIAPPSLEDTIKTYIVTGRMDVASADDAAFDFLDGNSDINADVLPSDLDVFQVASSKQLTDNMLVTPSIVNSDVVDTPSIVNSDVVDTPDVSNV